MPRAASRLRRIVLLAGAPAAALAVAGVAFLANQGTSGEIQRNAAARLQTSAARLSRVVDQYLQERRADLRTLAHAPGVVDAVRAASTEATRLGFDRLAANEISTALTDSVALNTPGWIGNLLGSQIGFTAMTLTERHGILLSNTSAGLSDLVTSGEEWWRRAMQEGEFRGTADRDPATGTWGYGLAIQVFDPEIDEPIGVLRGVVSLEPIERIFVSDRAAVSVALVDSLRRVLLTDDSTSITALENAGVLPLSPNPTVALRQVGSSEAFVAAVPVSRSPSWWLIAQEPLNLSNGAATSIRNALYTIGGVMLALTLVVFLILTRWLDVRVTRPVRAAGTITQRIADGDLTVELLDQRQSSDEVGDLLTSIGQMVTALRTLVGAIRTSAEDSSAMAGQISASTEQMSAGSQQMASTCQDLAAKASQHARLIRQTATDAGRMLEIASNLAEGTNRAATRNMALKQAADDHRTRLLKGSEQLTELADDIRHGSEEAQSLSEMSAEIQKFVSQAQSIAADTNMLSLNAAIEASRAEGGDGRGFGVVADEVRKMAAQAARAAADTEITVNRILQIVDTTRARLERLAEGSTAVQEVAESAALGLQEVADTAAEHSVWTEEISSAANGAQTLVAEMTRRLTTLADGTETFLNAVEELAATAQEQTASTEEIAGSAGQLASASDRLTENVSSFRLHNGKPRESTLTSSHGREDLGTEAVASPV